MKSSIVLIVDDNTTNLNVLFDALKSAEYKVLTARNGQEALQRIEHTKPDIILLDIKMPILNGFEACKLLKEDNKTKDIPVIFLTALDEIENKVKGFELGAVDYITKPLQQVEVLARVKTHLTISIQQKELEKQNIELSNLNKEKNEFLGIASHDLKNPLNVLFLLTSMLIKHRKNLGDEKVDEKLKEILHSSYHMLDIINKFLDIHQIESGQILYYSKDIDVSKTITKAVSSFSNQAESKSINIHYTPSELPIIVETDESILTNILENLISNALKFSHPNQNIYIELKSTPDTVRFEVQDEGQGLTEADTAQLFQKFTRLSAKPTGKEHSTGLGLSIVKKLTDMIGGKVWAESEGKGRGAKFIMEVPFTK
ncbi:MAG: hybrid sensor histidine kinase/response regulator [Leptospiraceae bacterium]|nr:hybrid sensor histidine kinase/response regulator [Leptospiraceae bacterium]MCP5494932.1 hybrid sensor histidine kinase/response regulator [Leptospiraceae bacterium]